MLLIISHLVPFISRIFLILYRLYTSFDYNCCNAGNFLTVGLVKVYHIFKFKDIDSQYRILLEQMIAAVHQVDPLQHLSP